MGAQQLLSGSVVLGASTSIYTASTSPTRIEVFTLTNNSGSAVDVSLHFVRPGDSPTPDNAVSLLTPVPASSSIRATAVEGHVLPKGWTLFGVPSVAGMVVPVVSGTPIGST